MPKFPPKADEQRGNQTPSRGPKKLLDRENIETHQSKLQSVVSAIKSFWSSSSSSSFSLSSAHIFPCETRRTHARTRLRPLPLPSFERTKNLLSDQVKDQQRGLFTQTLSFHSIVTSTPPPLPLSPLAWSHNKRGKRDETHINQFRGRGRGRGLFPEIRPRRV